MKIYLLHTVRPGLNTFQKKLQKAFPDVELEVCNIMDDFWIYQTGKYKSFTKKCKKHLMQVCIMMEDAGADLIVCTCSSLTAYLKEIRDYISTPIVLIDETLPEVTFSYGRNILVFSTADTAVEAATEMLEEYARLNDIDCNVTPLCCDEAGQIMRSGGDMSKHDTIVINLLSDIKGYDAIVFSQLSTCHLAPEIQSRTGIPCITTPELCLNDLKNYITEI